MSDILNTDDAYVWAEEFMRKFGEHKNEIDTALMVGCSQMQLRNPTTYDPSRTLKRSKPLKPNSQRNGRRVGGSLWLSQKKTFIEQQAMSL